MKYEVHGPFVVPRESGLVARESLRYFWDTVDEFAQGLSGACGCYVFGLKAAKGRRPWYVGRTNNQGFRQECFAHHKLTNYNEVLHAHKGTPELYLVARVTARGRFCAPQSAEDVHFLEQFLISLALRRNPELKNRARTRLLCNLVVPGLINSPRGNPGADATALRKMLEG